MMLLKLGGIATLGVLSGESSRAPATVIACRRPPAVAALGLLRGAVPVLFAYGGWENSGSIAAEVRDPLAKTSRTRTSWGSRPSSWSTSASTVYLRVLPPAESPLDRARGRRRAGARRRAGRVSSRPHRRLLLGFIAVIIMTGPRLYYAMAD